MRIGASKLHGPPHTATAPGTSLLLSQQPLPVARGRPPCRCFCRWPCSPIVRVLLHMPRGCAPRAALALLHAGRCARRRLLPCARRTRLSRPPCALHRLRRHRRTPPTPATARRGQPVSDHTRAHQGHLEVALDTHVLTRPCPFPAGERDHRILDGRSSPTVCHGGRTTLLWFHFS